MKVLFVSSGNKKDGPGTVVKNQADSLSKTGIKIDFFLIKGTGFLGYLKNIAPLFNHLKKNNYDIIHSHYSLSAFVTTISLWGSKNTTHIVSLMGSDTKTKGLIKKLILYFSTNFWNKTIVKCQSMQQDIGLLKAEILPNGVSISKIKELEQDISKNKKSNASRKEKTILFVANPDREVKNFALAQEAVDIAKQKIKVIFDRSHSEILKEIKDADIILLTSFWEGSPNIIKEAMACNRPVVATDVGDVRWLFGNESGYFITTFEPTDVAEKIKHALEYSDKYGQTKGRQRILELGVDSDSIAERLVRVYREARN